MEFFVVQEVATFIGCSVIRLTFIYLGVLVASNMTHIDSWKLIISRLVSKNSSWKEKFYLKEEG